VRTDPKAALKEWLTRPSTGVAIALMAVGLLFAVVEVQSPSRLYWTGDAVGGTNTGGIVFYTVQGERYTVDDPGPVPAHDTAVTVYVNPDDPSEALLSGPTRWVDAAAVGGWFVAALVLLFVAALRRTSGIGRGARNRGRASDETSESDWIAQYLDRSQRAVRRPPDR
jgi:hypothetical protein